MLLILLLACLGAVSLKAAGASAQTPAALTFSGTVSNNLLQPVPAGTPITAVVAATNETCGESLIGAGGRYSVTVIAAAPCNSVGTPLVFKVGALVASPTAFVTTSSGAITLNLTVNGYASTGTSGSATSTSANVLVPPANASAGSSTPQSSAGTLVPPANPPGQTTAPASAAVSAATTAAAAQTVPVALTAGCNQVVVALGANAQPQAILADVVNPSAVLSIWHFDNASQRYSGYFPTPGVPSDLTSLQPIDAVFICVNADTTINAPQP